MTTISPGFYSFWDSFGNNYGSLELYHYHAAPDTEKSGWYWQSRFQGRPADAAPEGPFDSAEAALRDASPNHPILKGISFASKAEERRYAQSTKN